jgi:two-component system cell cycle sensor histidine kinase/response regulator CckA
MQVAHLSREDALPTGGTAGTILVVEDTEAVRKLVCALLAQGGYTCLEAADGMEALMLAERRIHELALVVTDIVMPQMNGSELAARVALLRPDLPILFMSGFADDPILESIGKSSFPFLPKPFTSEALMQAVRQVLDAPWTGLPELGSGSSLQ